MSFDRKFSALGKHLIADFHGAQALFDPEPFYAILAAAAKAAKATVLDIQLHDFGTDVGFTGVALLAESHISIHTWPEYEHAAIDIFMCGEADPYLSLKVLEAYFKPATSSVQLIERGLPEHFRQTTLANVS